MVDATAKFDLDVQWDNGANRRRRPAVQNGIDKISS